MLNLTTLGIKASCYIENHRKCHASISFRLMVDYDFSFSNGAFAVKTKWSANLVFNIFIVSYFKLADPLIP